MKRKVQFKTYSLFNPTCKVQAITPEDEFHIHTFFDVCPWSPSGRYIVSLKLPFQSRGPGPEDTAEVCIIDLQEQTIESIYETKGWGMQLGAHQCWGKTDDTLYFNDKQDGLPIGIQYDVRTGTSRKLEGPIYQVAPDETFAISPCQIRTDHTQEGYGVTVAFEYDIVQPIGPSANDGIYKVDLKSGKNSLLLSFEEIYEALPDKEVYEGGKFYGSHVKFNKQQTRIMFVVRWRHPNVRLKNMLITCNIDGSDVKVAIPWQSWTKGGHHPDWHPDGNKVLMNLKSLGKGLQFYQANWDGSDPKTLVPDIPGSGHPSWSSDGRYIVTDAYPDEAIAIDEIVPIRLIDMEQEKEQQICRIWTLGTGKTLRLIAPDYQVDPAKANHLWGGLELLRCDPHPAWDRESKQICFVGAPEGKRQLFIADLSQLMN